MARRPPTVFVIGDDVSFLRSVSRLLRASGFNVVIHNSAAEFLGELRPDAAGCVITDLMMPGIDGMALQEALAKSCNPLPHAFFEPLDLRPTFACCSHSRVPRGTLDHA